MRKQYEYRHVTCFEETNIMGNVYFSNYISWQGRCREMFLREKTPDLLRDIENGKLSLVTLHCSCTFLTELKAFEEVSISMSLDSVQHNRIKMFFEYNKITDSGGQAVATGIHEIGCFWRNGEQLEMIQVPESLRQALKEYEK